MINNQTSPLSANASQSQYSVLKYMRVKRRSIKSQGAKNAIKLRKQAF